MHRTRNSVAGIPVSPELDLNVLKRLSNPNLRRSPSVSIPAHPKLLGSKFGSNVRHLFPPDARSLAGGSLPVREHNSACAEHEGAELQSTALFCGLSLRGRGHARYRAGQRSVLI